MQIFRTLNNDLLANLINEARNRVIYTAPGISSVVATAIVNFICKYGKDKVDVVVDSNPEICRLGYGNVEALELLFNNQVVIRKATGIRIGIIVVDDRAYVFTPTPLLVENEPTDNSPNAIFVDSVQAKQLIQAICPSKTYIEDNTQNGQLILTDVNCYKEMPQIGSSNISKKEVNKLKEELKLCPPQKFDLARRVRVYHSYVQFIDLKLNGCNIERHTVNIPSKLLNLTKNSEDTERLKATYRLLGENSKISGKPMEDKVNSIRKKYIRSLGPRFGNVLLRQKKDELLKEVEKVREELNKFKIDAENKLTKEFDKSKKELIKVLLPGVVKNPPDDLLGSILTNKPSQSQAKSYLENILDNIMPSVCSFVSEMNLQCDFKDITYEMLTDNEFLDALRKTYNYIQWPSAHEEYEAAKQV